MLPKLGLFVLLPLPPPPVLANAQRKTQSPALFSIVTPKLPPDGRTVTDSRVPSWGSGLTRSLHTVCRVNGAQVESTCGLGVDSTCHVGLTIDTRDNIHTMKHDYSEAMLLVPGDSHDFH